MGTKNTPGLFDCYAAAEPDEPMFVLLARDRHASALVNLWACMRLAANGVNDPKMEEAAQCANAMVAWRMARFPAKSDLSGIRSLANALALLAESCGAVVTIEQRSLQPLAMGHYEHVVTVRPKRERAER